MKRVLGIVMVLSMLLFGVANSESAADTLIDVFEDPSTWKGFSANDFIIVGPSSLCLDIHGGKDNSGAQKVFGAEDMRDYETFKMEVRLTGVQNLSIMLSSDPWYVTNRCKEFVNLPDGLYTLTWKMSDMKNSSQALDAISRIMLRAYRYSDRTTGRADILSLSVNFEKRPRVLVMMDDCSETAFTKGYTYMQSKGLVGTMYCVPSFVGQDGFMTLKQLHTIYDNGWDIGNHTYSHTRFDQMSGDKLKQEIRDCTNWLQDNGFTRAADHLAYPGGFWTAEGFEVLAELGIKTARIITNPNCPYVYPPIFSYMVPCALELKSTTTLVDVQKVIDCACDTGVTAILFGHQIADSPTLEHAVSTDVFRGMVDYLVQKKVACMTISQWYDDLN